MKEMRVVFLDFILIASDFNEIISTVRYAWGLKIVLKLTLYCEHLAESRGSQIRL